MVDTPFQRRKSYKSNRAAVDRRIGLILSERSRWLRQLSFESSNNPDFLLRVRRYGNHEFVC
jgi:hypothetical protein